MIKALTPFSLKIEKRLDTALRQICLFHFLNVIHGRESSADNEGVRALFHWNIVVFVFIVVIYTFFPPIFLG